MAAGVRGRGGPASAALAALVLAAACGVGPQGTPVRISAEDVPADLRVTGGSTTTSSPEDTRRVEVFLVANRGLVGVGREVPADEPLLQGTLDALAAGPTTAEAASGLRSALPAEGRIDAGKVDGRVATVDLPSSFVELTPAEQGAALAQLVYSATTVSGVDAVRFTVGGKPVAVPRLDGTLTREPVTRADFAGFAGR